MLRSAIVVCGLCFLNIADEPENPAAKLRTKVSDALVSLTQVGAFEVKYSTFQVLPGSDLGRQLSPSLSPDTAMTVKPLIMFNALMDATKATKLSTYEQVVAAQASTIPEYARARGLLVGGGPMTFQVVQGQTAYMQTCTSDPLYYSIVRLTDIDIVHFAADARLEIGPRNNDIMLFTVPEYCHPLPVSSSSRDYFLAAEWRVNARIDGLEEIHAVHSSTGNGHTALIMGGPGCAFPLYCAWGPIGQGTKYVQVVHFSWTFDGNGATLESVMQLNSSPAKLNVVMYQLKAGESSVADADCALVVQPLKLVFDSRGGERVAIEADSIPVAAAAHVIVHKD